MSEANRAPGRVSPGDSFGESWRWPGKGWRGNVGWVLLAFLYPLSHTWILPGAFFEWTLGPLYIAFLFAWGWVAAALLAALPGGLRWRPRRENVTASRRTSGVMWGCLLSTYVVTGFMGQLARRLGGEARI